MKITKRQLQQIIKEELRSLLNETDTRSGQDIKRAGTVAKRAEEDRVARMSPEEKGEYLKKQRQQYRDSRDYYEKRNREEREKERKERRAELQSQGVTDDFMKNFEEGIANGRFTRKELQEYIQQEVMKVFESHKAS